MKSQSTIISTLLISGIILSIITATYVWGQPLIQKTTDKIKVDKYIEDLNLIKDKIDYTQKTGSPSEVLLNIRDASVQIKPNENSIIIKTSTRIPIISSFSYIPISYYELAYETNLIDVNTSEEGYTTNNPPGTTGIIHKGNITLENVLYNLTVYNTTNSDKYDYVCIYQGSDVNNVDDDCTPELGEINKNGVIYTVSWISDDGTEVIISGGIKENIGLLGIDPAGIISGKSQPTGNGYSIILKLSYRGLKDKNNHIYKTIIQCDSGCSAGTGVQKLRIEKAKTERLENQTLYYISVFFS